MIADPHHLPRWWPRVTRVEAVDDASFTEVFSTKKGRPVRADFRVVESDAPGRRRMWAQELEGSPFARFLKSAETEVRLDPAPGTAAPRSRSSSASRRMGSSRASAAS